MVAAFGIDWIHAVHHVAQKSNIISLPRYSSSVIVAFPSGWFTTCNGRCHRYSEMVSPICRGAISATAAAAGSACWAETCFAAYKHMLVNTASRLMYLYNLFGFWLEKAHPSPTRIFRIIYRWLLTV